MPPRAILVFFALWTGLTLVFAGQSVLYDWAAGRPARLLGALLSSAMYWYLWGVLAVPILVVSARYPLARGRRPLRLAAHGVAMIGVALTHVALRWLLERSFWERGADTVQEIFVEQVHLNLLVYCAVVGASHARFLHQEALRHARALGSLAIEAARLEASVATSRMSALRAQLQPHFLFNALQAVSTLMRQDVGKADRTLGQLSRLLRAVVDTTDTYEVPLREEMRFAEDYLAIQSTRFGGRLLVDIRIPEDCLDAMVPTLVLQPLIENACVHGLGRWPGEGMIRVAADMRAPRDSEAIAATWLRITVANDGPPAATDLREGTGLKITRERLAAMYGPAQCLQIRQSSNGRTEVVVELPLRRSSEVRPHAVVRTSRPANTVVGDTHA